jgi:carboxylesterase type B
MSVQFHLTSPLSQPFFSRAIMESSFGVMTYKSRKQALQFGSFFSEQMGCGDDAIDALACMRNASSDAVKAAWVGLGGNIKKIAEMVIDWQNLAVALTFSPAVLETAEWSLTPSEHLNLLLLFFFFHRTSFIVGPCNPTKLPPADSRPTFP